jgi:hypothetical protein
MKNLIVSKDSDDDINFHLHIIQINITSRIFLKLNPYIFRSIEDISGLKEH